MSTTNNNSGERWDPLFVLTFQDGSFRRVHSEFLESAARDRRTGEIIALDSNNKLQWVAKIRVIPPKYR